MDDADFIPKTICSNCWYQSERIVYNINGRCDTCGGVDFIEHGVDPDTTQELERPETPEDYPETDFDYGPQFDEEETNSISSREKVKKQLDEMREKKYPNPLRKPGFFKD